MPHSRFTQLFVAQALGLRITGLEDLPAFTSVTSDSRKVTVGSLFVPLLGETFDGHDFIGKAIESGAQGVVCRKNFPIEGYPHVRFFQVDDTLQAYRRLAAAWRREFHLPLIAITGSAGKTTTKELLAAILSGKWARIHRTQASQNGFVGIPMTLLELKGDEDAAVIEIGIDEIGAMQSHIELVAPSATLLTSVGPEHLEKLRDIASVASEEGISLSYTAQNGGFIAVNLDDPWIKPHFRTVRSEKKAGFTLHPLKETKDEKQIYQGVLHQNGESLQILDPELGSWSLPLPLLGSHNARNLLGAVCVARHLGLTPEEIQRGLSSFKGAFGRTEIYTWQENLPVLCDYYNAQPLSVAAGLEVLRQIADRSSPSRTKWVCLGDMLELGVEEERFHRELADGLIQSGIGNVMLYGERMKWLEDELKKRAYSGCVLHFDSHASLALHLKNTLDPQKDALMIKGSRGMKMEEIWKLLQ